METQKILNLLNSSENEFSKFATRKWYVIDSESNNGCYSHHDVMKFLIKLIESYLCDYSDAYILVTGNITVERGDNNTKVAFKNCAAFRKCKTEMNDTYVDEAEFIDVEMPMYNLTEYITIIIRILREVYGSLKEIKIMQLVFILFCYLKKIAD